MPFLSLLRNFAKNYWSYKPFYLRTIKQILYMGISPSRVYYVNTALNISDHYTRLISMEASKLDQMLEKFDNGSYDLRSLILGYFYAQKYFNELENPPTYLPFQDAKFEFTPKRHYTSQPHVCNN